MNETLLTNLLLMVLSGLGAFSATVLHKIETQLSERVKNLENKVSEHCENFALHSQK